MKTNDRAHVDKRITSTRNTILDAAISLYRKLGIEKTSISQVIDLSEVGRSTFYRHCSGRDDLLNQVLNRDFDALMLEFQSNAPNSKSMYCLLFNHLTLPLYFFQ